MPANKKASGFRLQASGGRQKKKQHWPRTFSLFSDSFFLARA
jgi:hypothetical protein